MSRALCAVAAALLPCALGHGYVQTPASRGWGCMSDNGQLRNTGCGQVQWEAWSVEGNDGSPRYPAQAANGIPDGRIASANRPRALWAQLDVQTATRWDKVSLQSGVNEFRWVFVAPHATRDFRYFMTKVGWDANAPLTRASFDKEPFCTVEMGGELADTNPNHMCNVPTRSGYAVVLAVWDVSDTDQSFYNVIDAIIDGTAAPPTTAVPGVATTSPCSAPVGPWGNCHHVGGCCTQGWECVRQSDYYSQCLPEAEPTSAPVTDAPATDAPATDAPVTDAPATDAPATDAPATDAPVTDAPVTDAPATDAPATTAVPLPTTTTAPVPTPVPGPSVCKAWDACTGRPGCCQAGLDCVERNPHYSQCVPSRVPPPAPPGCDAAVGEWGECTRARGCCVGWTVCVELNPYYAQCRRQ